MKEWIESLWTGKKRNTDLKKNTKILAEHLHLPTHSCYTLFFLCPFIFLSFFLSARNAHYIEP